MAKKGGTYLSKEVVITPKGNYIIPSLEAFKEQKAADSREFAAKHIQYQHGPNIPLIPSRAPWSWIAGKIMGMSDKERIRRFGTADVQTCIYTATSQYRDKYARVSGNKTFRENPEKFGFYEVPMDSAKVGDLIQLTDFTGTPHHSTILTGKNKAGDLFVSYSNGSTQPYEVFEGDTIWTMKKNMPIEIFGSGDDPIDDTPAAFRYVGSPGKQQEWTDEYIKEYGLRKEDYFKTPTIPTYTEQPDALRVQKPLIKAEGGFLGPKDAWDKLSMREKAEMIRVGVQNGLLNLQDIRKKYNEFAEGGKTEDEQYYDTMEKVAEENYKDWGFDTPNEALVHALNDNTYNYRDFYREYPWSDANARTHWTDEFKTVYHPTFSVESKYSGKKSQYNPAGLFGGHWIEDKFVPAPWQVEKKHSIGGPLVDAAMAHYYDGTNEESQQVQKVSPYRYVLTNDGQWNRVTNDPMGVIFQDFAATPSRIIAHDTLDVDTRSDTTRRGYHEGYIPWNAGRSGSADSPLYLTTANITNNPNIITGEPLLPMFGKVAPPDITERLLKFIGKSPTQITRTPLSKANEIRIKGLKDEQKSELMKQATIFKEAGVDTDRISWEDILNAYDRREAALRVGRPERFSIVRPAGDNGFNVYDNIVKGDDIRRIGRTELYGGDDGNLHMGYIENLTRLEKNKIGGVQERGLDAAINTAKSIGRRGVISGEDYQYAPLQLHVIDKFSTKELLPGQGFYSNINAVKDYNKVNKIPQSIFAPRQHVYSIEEMKQAPSSIKTILSGSDVPAYYLTEPTMHVPTKASVFDPRRLTEDGQMIVDWDDPFIFSNGGILNKEQHDTR